jgi:hypothetical protein
MLGASDLLDSIFLSISVDHLPANLGAPLGHSNGKVDIPKGNDGDDKRVVGIELDQKVANGSSQVDQHRYHRESNLLEERIDGASFAKRREHLTRLLAKMEV